MVLLYEQDFLVGRVENSKDEGSWLLRRGVRPGKLTGSRLTHPELPQSDEGNFLCLGAMKVFLSYEVCELL